MPNTSHPALPSLTRQLNKLADDGVGPVRLADELGKLAPDLASQVKADGGRPGVLQRWGTSSRSDVSHPETPTVEPDVLSAIGLLAGGVDLSGDIVHAGLMHTYGYLLSNLKTPFGFKRQRYTQASIARGLGLQPLGILSPWPTEGTLLANLTRVAGAIALPAPALGEFSGDAASLRAFDPGAFEHARVLETVRTVDGVEIGGALVLQTDLVTLRDHDHDENSHLLVYSIVRDGDHRLVTAFPVAPWTLKKLRKQSAKAAGSEDTPIRLRYNARLAEFEGVEFRGSVEMIEVDGG